VAKQYVEYQTVLEVQERGQVLLSVYYHAKTIFFVTANGSGASTANIHPLKKTNYGTVNGADGHSSTPISLHQSNISPDVQNSLTPFIPLFPQYMCN